MWTTALHRGKALQCAYGYGAERTVHVRAALMYRGRPARWAIGVAVGGAVASPWSWEVMTPARCEGQPGCLPGDPLGAIMVSTVAGIVATEYLAGWYEQICGGVQARAPPALLQPAGQAAESILSEVWHGKQPSQQQQQPLQPQPQQTLLLYAACLGAVCAGGYLCTRSSGSIAAVAARKTSSAPRHGTVNRYLAELVYPHRRWVGRRRLFGRGGTGETIGLEQASHVRRWPDLRHDSQQPQSQLARLIVFCIHSFCRVWNATTPTHLPMYALLILCCLACCLCNAAGKTQVIPLCCSTRAGRKFGCAPQFQDIAYAGSLKSADRHHG